MSVMQPIRADEIALNALVGQKGGHLRGGRKAQGEPVSWPVAGIGRISSPRSVAELDGE
jgi:hypothetical protein